jgi:hypothetical protein
MGFVTASRIFAGLILFFAGGGLVFAGDASVHFDFEQTPAGNRPPDLTSYRFQGPPLLQAKVRERLGNRFFQVRADKAGSLVHTFFTKFNNPQQQADFLQLKLRYRATGDQIKPIFVLARKPGAVQPQIKERPAFKRDGQWHTLRLKFPLAGFKADKLTFEMIVEGGVSRGDTFSIDDVSLTPSREARRPVQATLISPAMGQLVVDAGDSAVLLDVVTDSDCRLRIAVLTEQGKARLRRTMTIDGRRRVALDASDLSVGTYTLKVQAADRDWSKRWKLQCHPYSEPNVFIRDHVLHVNGEPFFPIGLYHTGDLEIRQTNDAANRGVGSFTLDREKLFRALKRRHFNTVQYTHGVPPTSYMDLAEKYDLKVLPEGDKRVKKATQLRRHPALLYYQTEDEPVPQDSQRLTKVFRRYREMDPYHPVGAAIHNGGVGFTDRLMNIPMPDPYVTRSPSANLEHSINHVGQCMRLMNKDDPRSAVIMVPQLWTASGPAYQGHIPDYKQVRAEVFGALTAGATGIVYYGFRSHEQFDPGMPKNPRRKHWFLPESKLWNQIGRLNKQVQEVAPTILTAQRQNILKHPDDTPAFAARWGGDHQSLVIVVNPTAQRLTDVRLRESTSPKQWAPLLGSTSPPAAESESTSAALSMSPYQVRIYRSRR